MHTVCVCVEGGGRVCVCVCACDACLCVEEVTLTVSGCVDKFAKDITATRESYHTLL